MKQENIKYLNNGIKISWKGDKPLFDVNAIQTKIWQDKKSVKSKSQN